MQKKNLTGRIGELKINQDMTHDKAVGFPRHGWAYNGDQPGTAMLWLPPFRLLADQGFYRIKLGKDPDGLVRRYGKSP